MAKLKPIENDIEALYRLSTLDVMMLMWVEALRSKIPLSIEKCILDFFNHYDIQEEDYPLDSARVIYSRNKQLLNDWEIANK